MLHALPGFWHPEDLAAELSFAKEMHQLWLREDISADEKRQEFTTRQLARVEASPLDTFARSGWQGFDRKNELKRLANGVERDTFVTDLYGDYVLNDAGDPVSKPINMLVHERLAARPFVPFESFDVREFADYGRRYYDNNKKVDGEGSTFMTPKRVAKAEQREAKRQRAEQRRLAKERRRRGGGNQADEPVVE